MKEAIEIQDKNKLIHEFMGNPKDSWPRYNFDWDQLMCAVEKVEATHHDIHGFFGVHISSNSCTIQGTNFSSQKKYKGTWVYFNDITHKTKLLATWYAIASWIDWYNKEILNKK